MVEKEIEAYCPKDKNAKCRKDCGYGVNDKVLFKYIGEQKGRKKNYDLYNCPKRRTLGEETILNFNK